PVHPTIASVAVLDPGQDIVQAIEERHQLGPGTRKFHPTTPPSRSTDMTEMTGTRRLAIWALLGALFAIVLTAPTWAQAPAPSVATRHPLDPLTPEDINAAVAAIRKDERFADSFRFVSISSNEPSKETVRRWRPGDPPAREAFLVLLDRATGRGHEAVVDLASGKVRRFDMLPE